MAKRGETRPWLVRYEWGNGVKGANSCTTLDKAQLRVDQQLRASHHRGMSLSLTVTNRETGRTWSVEHPSTCEVVEHAD